MINSVIKQHIRTELATTPPVNVEGLQRWSKALLLGPYGPTLTQALADI